MRPAPCMHPVFPCLLPGPHTNRPANSNTLSLLPRLPPTPTPHPPAPQTSNALSKLYGPYETYEGSPVSKGVLQHDMWGVKAPSDRWDWDGLRESIRAHGVRNSLLLAPMPTASTSQVGRGWGCGRGWGWSGGQAQAAGWEGQGGIRRGRQDGRDRVEWGGNWVGRQGGWEWRGQQSAAGTHSQHQPGGGRLGDKRGWCRVGGTGGSWGKLLGKLQGSRPGLQFGLDSLGTYTRAESVRLIKLPTAAK